MLSGAIPNFFSWIFNSLSFKSSSLVLFLASSSRIFNSTLVPAFLVKLLTFWIRFFISNNFSKICAVCFCPKAYASAAFCRLFGFSKIKDTKLLYYTNIEHKIKKVSFCFEFFWRIFFNCCKYIKVYARVVKVLRH